MLAVQLRLTEWEACAPEPESEIERGEFVAVLMTDTLPVALPVAVGANRMLKLAACPGDNKTGGTRPLALKLLPVTLTWEMETFELPVFVRVML